MPAVELRAAGPADVEAFDELRLRTWRTAYRGLLPDAVLAALAVTPQMTAERRERLAGGGSLMHVAAEGGRLVGVAEACAARDEDLDADAVTELAALYVDPSEWGRGTGRALLEAVLARRARPLQSLWVLEASTGSQAFYARCGFQADGCRRSVELGRPVGEVRYLRRA